MNDPLDEALERSRGTGTEVAGGIAPNHGPMGAEALVAIGAQRRRCCVGRPIPSNPRHHAGAHLAHNDRNPEGGSRSR